MVYEITGQSSKRFTFFHEFYTWSFLTSGFHRTWIGFVAAPIPSQNMFDTFSIMPLPDGYNITCIYNYIYPYIYIYILWIFFVFLDLTFQLLSPQGALNTWCPDVMRCNRTLNLSEDIFAGLDFVLRADGRQICHKETMAMGLWCIETWAAWIKPRFYMYI